MQNFKQRPQQMKLWRPLIIHGYFKVTLRQWQLVSRPFNHSIIQRKPKYTNVCIVDASSHDLISCCWFEIVMIRSILSFPFHAIHAPLLMASCFSGSKRAAGSRAGKYVSIFLFLYKVQCFTKDEIHI